MGLNTPTSARFVEHACDEFQIARMKGIRAACGELANEIVTTCLDTRERALALTKLEEVMFWANASVAREKSLQPPRDG